MTALQPDSTTAALSGIFLFRLSGGLPFAATAEEGSRNPGLFGDWTPAFAGVTEQLKLLD